MAGDSQLSGTKLYLILPRSGENLALPPSVPTQLDGAPSLWWNDINVWGFRSTVRSNFGGSLSGSSLVVFASAFDRDCLRVFLDALHRSRRARRIAAGTYASCAHTYRERRSHPPRALFLLRSFRTHAQPIDIPRGAFPLFFGMPVDIKRKTVGFADRCVTTPPRGRQRRRRPLRQHTPAAL